MADYVSGFTGANIDKTIQSGSSYQGFITASNASFSGIISSSNATSTPVILTLPTSDPGVVGALWVSGSTAASDTSKILVVSQG